VRSRHPLTRRGNAACANVAAGRRGGAGTGHKAAPSEGAQAAPDPLKVSEKEKLMSVLDRLQADRAALDKEMRREGWRLVFAAIGGAVGFVALVALATRLLPHVSC
jgi:hypothetical protein